MYKYINIKLITITLYINLKFPINNKNNKYFLLFTFSIIKKL